MGTAFFAGARPKNLATVGTIATVTPRRMGSVNFVITQDIANVPTDGERYEQSRQGKDLPQKSTRVEVVTRGNRCSLAMSKHLATSAYHEDSL